MIRVEKRKDGVRDLRPNDVELTLLADDLPDVEVARVTLEYVEDAQRLIVEVYGTARNYLTVETVVRPD